MANHAERCWPLERANYFTGQLLSAGDLQAEQEYVRGLHRRHVRMCHGWGVVEGLVVVGGESVHQIVVELGFALSPDGSEICIPHRVELELRPLLGASAVEYLAVRAIEMKVDPDRVVGVGDAGESEHSRVRESFEIAVLDGLPGSHERGHGGNPRSSRLGSGSGAGSRDVGPAGAVPSIARRMRPARRLMTIGWSWRSWCALVLLAAANMCGSLLERVDTCADDRPVNVNRQRECDPTVCDAAVRVDAPRGQIC